MNVKNVIQESVDSAVERYYIREMVKRELMRRLNEELFERDKNKKDDDEGAKKGKQASSASVSQLAGYFKNHPEIKQSEIAYDLYSDELGDAEARHKLSYQLKQKIPMDQKDAIRAFNIVVGD